MMQLPNLSTIPKSGKIISDKHLRNQMSFFRAFRVFAGFCNSLGFQVIRFEYHLDSFIIAPSFETIGVGNIFTPIVSKHKYGAFRVKNSHEELQKFFKLCSSDNSVLA